MTARKLRRVITVLAVATAGLVAGTGVSSALELDGVHIGGHDGIGKNLTKGLSDMTSDRELQVP